MSALGPGGVPAALVETQASVGGGSLPGETLASWAVALRPESGSGADALAQRLRLGSGAGSTPGVFGRIEEGRVLVDLRTVLPEDDASLADAVIAAYRRQA